MLLGPSLVSTREKGCGASTTQGQLLLHGSLNRPHREEREAVLKVPLGVGEAELPLVSTQEA